MTMVAANEPTDVVSLQKELRRVRAQLAATELKLACMWERWQLERHRLYGRSAEDASSQGELFNEVEMMAEPVVAADSQIPSETTTASKPSRGGRRPLPTHLPRIEIVHALPETQRVCGCGCIQQEIGRDVSEQLDIIPMRVQVLRHVRVRYACRCGDHAPVTTPLPAQPIPKSIASPGTLAMIATLKFVDGVPLYRIAQRVLQRTRADIPRQTLARWMIQLAQLLRPLLNLLRETLHEGVLIHMDETTTQVLKEPDKPPESASYMWVQVGGPPQKPVILFNYDPRRAGSVPVRLLDGWTGTLMTDGYDGYTAVVAASGITHLCCMAHARRRFIDAQRAQPSGKTGKADVAIGLIGKLYAIERRIANAIPEIRRRVRQNESRAILDQLRRWLDESLPTVTPKSTLGGALAYLDKYWPRLTRYIEDPRWPIDNNAAENAIRPFVIGRNNWIFNDTPNGAHASAAIYSLIETARANGLEPYTYLRHVARQLPQAQSLLDMEALLPWNLCKADLITELGA